MPFVVAIALAGVLARGSAEARPDLLGAKGEVQVRGDKISYDAETGRVLLEGNAFVRRGAVAVRARSISWDPSSDEVRASGGVLLTDATRVISADAIRAVLGEEVEAEGVLAFVKNQPADLSGLRTVAEAKAAGRNRLTFSGDRVGGNPEERLQLSGARLTLCDCAAGRPPSWEVSARDAEIVRGRRAILHWPVLWITPRFSLLGRPVPLVWFPRPVPVLALPWLYLPLGDRQSGMLFPVIGNSGASGFSVAEPLYLTLGRSADATLTPEYALGPRVSDAAKGAVRGPGARLELRWAPAEAAAGQLELAWLHDLEAEPRGEAGDRWAFTARHGQRLGDRTTVAAWLRLAGDPVWVRDTTPDVLGRTMPYRRSDLLVSYREDRGVGEAFASYDQPLRPLGTGPLPEGTVQLGTFPTGPYGLLGADVGVSSRWASAAAALVPVPIGPLRLSARSGMARFGPARGGLDVVGRPKVTRADARAELEAPILLGDALTVSPFVRGAALGYAFDEARDPAASAWGVAGATVATEVSRRFGSLRHAIAPRLEWRAGTRAQGEVLPFPAFDALDRSSAGLIPTPAASFQQLRAAVESRLQADGRDLLRAELGQDVDLRAGRLAETFAVLSAAAGPVHADARASFFADGREGSPPPAKIPSRLDRLSELSASASLQDGRGDMVRAGFFSIAPGGSSRLVVGIDPLFDLRPASAPEAGGASAGFTAIVGNAKLSYDASFFGRATKPQSCAGEAARRFDALEVQQQTGTLSWETSCHCFRVALNAGYNYCGTVSYSASIDLAGLAGAFR